jgi:chromosome segregation ATPase
MAPRKLQMWRALLLLWLALRAAVGVDPPLPHFLTSADNFLRSSSRRVGEAAANVLQVQSSLDDMKEDLSGEYTIWEKKKTDLAAERERYTEEIAKLKAVLLEQASLREKKLRLETSLAEQRNTTAHITMNRELLVHHWTLEQVALTSDIAMLEKQLNHSQATKIDKIRCATARVADVQSRNRYLQTEIFNVNQQVFELGNILANRTVTFKQQHSELLNEVTILQNHIHSLQDDVVARAKVQLELQRRWKRLAQQASEVVRQKQVLQSARSRCEKEMESLDGKIWVEQREMKVATTELVSCQELDAQGQVLQGKLNECRASLR